MQCPYYMLSPRSYSFVEICHKFENELLPTFSMQALSRKEDKSMITILGLTILGESKDTLPLLVF